MLDKKGDKLINDWKTEYNDDTGAFIDNLINRFNSTSIENVSSPAIQIRKKAKKFSKREKKILLAQSRRNILAE